MPYYEFTCPTCFELNEISRPSCNDCGSVFKQTVNVRRALLPNEVSTLSDRFHIAKSELVKKGLVSEVDFFSKEVLTKGKAIINIDFPFLWDWLMHSKKTYQSYRRIVIEGLRRRAEFENDLQRSIVESYLFGSHVDIIYAALSLDESGLKSYGAISIVLKTKNIESRTSMLEMNSYKFVDIAVANHWTHKKPLPPGSMTNWGGRHKLALAKCNDGIKKGLNAKQAAELILYSDGNRANDEFMELYVYGNIVKAVVEKIKIPLSLIKGSKTKNGFDKKQLAQLEELKTKYVVEIY